MIMCIWRDGVWFVDMEDGRLIPCWRFTLLELVLK